MSVIPKTLGLPCSSLILSNYLSPPLLWCLPIIVLSFLKAFYLYLLLSLTHTHTHNCISLWTFAVLLLWRQSECKTFTAVNRQAWWRGYFHCLFKSNFIPYNSLSLQRQNLRQTILKMTYSKITMDLSHFTTVPSYKQNKIILRNLLVFSEKSLKKIGQFWIDGGTKFC